VETVAALLVILALALVVAVVSAPLRRGAAAPEEADSQRVRELEAAKEAKYREIREAELDHRTGKLDDDDFRALDRQLRGEAVAILRELDELQ
jgi:acetyl-CoA acetyltransferase